MTYPEAIQFLYGLRWFGSKLGLRNSLRLAELAGDPYERLRFIHVAGTNGKGSTCAMLESIYRSCGLRVGSFTSPHLVVFGERIQVDRKPLTESDVVGLVAGIQALLREFSAEEHPTFFEVVTVMALQYFAARECDLVIWETGLGGRLDATNIVTPLASIITNIQYDHQPRPAQWLTFLNPLRYYLVILRGIFLKGTGDRVLWPQMAALLILGGATLAVATRRFRKTMS